MKILYIMKNNFLLFLCKIKYNLGMLLIFPLLLGFGYGLMYEKLLTPEVKLKTLRLYTCYNQASEKEKGLIKTMLSYPNYSFIEEKEVSKDEINSLLSKNTDALGLVLEHGDLSLINYGDTTLEKNLLKEGLNKLAYLNTNNSPVLIESKSISIDPTLSSKPKMFLSVFCGVAFFIAINLGSFFLKRRETSLIKRLNGCNLSKKDLFLGECLFTLVITFSISMIYSLIAYKLILHMNLDLIKLLFCSFVQAILISCLYGFIIGILRTDKTLQLIFVPIIFILMFFGGTFFPLDAFLSPKNPMLLLNPTTNVTKVFEMALLNRPINTIYTNLIFLLILSLIFIAMGYLKFSLEEV